MVRYGNTTVYHITEVNHSIPKITKVQPGIYILATLNLKSMQKILITWKSDEKHSYHKTIQNFD